MAAFIAEGEEVASVNMVRYLGSAVTVIHSFYFNNISD